MINGSNFDNAVKKERELLILADLYAFYPPFIRLRQTGGLA
jgi:hypothetical protein